MQRLYSAKLKTKWFIVLLVLSAGFPSFAQPEDTFRDVPVWTDLAAALENPRIVRRLSLTKTNLRAIPPEVFDLYNLEELDLSKNQIKNLPPEISRLKKLRFLDISKNKLEELPKEIGELNNLEILMAGKNNIYRLPDEIGNCSALESLSLWDNNLSGLPVNLKTLSNLKEVDLRVTLFSDAAKAIIKEMLPGVNVQFSNECNCGPN